jgi:ATP-dependent RNA helicase DHX37/DHR1
MHALTDITGAYLSNLAKGTPLLQFGKPLKELRAWREGGESFRECWFVPYLRAEGTGGQGWPLPQKRVVQKRVPVKGWVEV